MNYVLVRRGEKTQFNPIQRGEHHVATEAAIGVMLLQAKNVKNCRQHWKLPQRPQCAWPSWSLDPDFSFQNYKRINACFYKPLNLWQFITAVLKTVSFPRTGSETLRKCFEEKERKENSKGRS